MKTALTLGVSILCWVSWDAVSADWRNIADEFQSTNTKFQYQIEVGAAQRLLYEYLHPDLPNLPAVRCKFRANRSMRDVEPGVELAVKNLNDWTPRS